jgi:hypothetical protein
VTTEETDAGHEDDLQSVSAPPARWGYEYVRPTPPRQSPERNHPPQQREPRRVPIYRASGLQQALTVAAVATIATLIIDSAFLFPHHKVSAVYVPAHLVAGFIAFRLGQTFARWRAMAQTGDATGRASMSVALAAANGVAAFAAPYVVLPVETYMLFRRARRAKSMTVPDPKDVERAKAEYAAAHNAWQTRVSQFEQAERRRFETVALWYPVCPSDEAAGVCVFGGTQVSWAASLFTLGATLIGAQRRLVICDLSRRVSTPALAEACRELNVPTRVTTLPQHASAAGLLAGLTWAELSTIVVEVLHASNADPAATRTERQEDRAIVREVADALDPQGEVSVVRLRQAMLVVEGATVRPGRDLMSDDEYDALAALYNEVQRQHGGVLERLTRIERALRDFQGLDGRAAPGDGAVVPLEAARSGSGSGTLEVMEVDKRADDLDNDRLVELLFQLVQRRVRLHASEADVLAILACDRVRRNDLESLLTYAQQSAIQVFLYFEHLRQDAVELVGAGGAAAAFFALANHREAKEASDFIGSEYRFVESQRTRSTGKSLSDTYGEQSSWGWAATGATQSSGTSFSRAMMKSSEYSVSDQRVREAIIEPELLMGLPSVQMVYVEVRTGGQRMVKMVDCHPARCLEERVAREPLALRVA